MNQFPEINSVVTLASEAASAWASSNGMLRSQLLNSLAQALENARTALIELADKETHLGAARLNGELNRTCFQLRGFAAVALDGEPYSTIDDTAIEGPPPHGRPHLRRVRVPLGPVAMFSASNFPFAFSVLGGDTASALAAGCPVVVKAHPAHIALSRAVHHLAGRVLSELNLPLGLIGLVDAGTHAAGLQLVSHPAIQAVAFTGSLAGGQALSQQVLARARPIPFYGELGSINPVVVLPEALAQSSDDHARELAISITQGSGQFCTSPGVILLLDNVESRAFAEQVACAVGKIDLHRMLSEHIQESFDAGVARLGKHEQVRVLTASGSTTVLPCGFVGQTNAAAFLADEALRHEVFGAACLFVLAQSLDEMGDVLEAIGGSLTVTIWGANADNERNLSVFRMAQKIAGRVLFKGVPTGVAVTQAQQHGGPYPSSTQPLFTSVGFTASDRFLRPLALQDAPSWLTRRQGVPA